MKPNPSALPWVGSSHVLEYSDLGMDYFYERKDAVGSAEKDYEYRARNIINEI